MSSLRLVSHTVRRTLRLSGRLSRTARACCSTDRHSSRLVLLRIVDSQPSLWPHANKHVPDEVACVFDVRVAQLCSEISMREGASIPLKVCPFDRDDRPLYTYVFIRWRFRLRAQTESARLF